MIEKLRSYQTSHKKLITDLGDYGTEWSEWSDFGLQAMFFWTPLSSYFQMSHFSIWVNFSDLTMTEPGIMVRNRGIIPKWSYYRLEEVDWLKREKRSKKALLAVRRCRRGGWGSCFTVRWVITWAWGQGDGFFLKVKGRTFLVSEILLFTQKIPEIYFEVVIS
jgi:hypothetical protein